MTSKERLNGLMSCPQSNNGVVKSSWAEYMHLEWMYDRRFINLLILVINGSNIGNGGLALDSVVCKARARVRAIGQMVSYVSFYG